LGALVRAGYLLVLAEMQKETTMQENGESKSNGIALTIESDDVFM